MFDWVIDNWLTVWLNDFLIDFLSRTDNSNRAAECKAACLPLISRGSQNALFQFVALAFNIATTGSSATTQTTVSEGSILSQVLDFPGNAETSSSSWFRRWQTRFKKFILFWVTENDFAIFFKLVISLWIIILPIALMY